MGMNQKGSISLDTIFVGIAILGFAMTLLLSLFLYDEVSVPVQTKILAEGVNPTSEEAINDTIADTRTALLAGDVGVLVIYVGLLISAIALALVIPSIPALVPFTIIMTMIGTFLAVIFSNIYEEISSATVLASNAAELPMTAIILGNLPIMVVVFGVTLTVVTFAKSRIQGGVQ
jgi:hypothetical protein